MQSLVSLELLDFDDEELQHEAVANAVQVADGDRVSLMESTTVCELAEVSLEEQKATFDKLPSEVIAIVLSCLQARSLGMAACVCPRLYALAVSEQSRHVQVFGGGAPEAWTGGTSEVARRWAKAYFGYSFLCLYPDGTRLVGVGSATSENEVSIYQPDASVVSVLQGHAVTVVSVATDGVLIASGDFSGVIRLWDAAMLQPDGQLQHGSDRVWGVALLGDLLVSSSEDSTVKRWAVSQRLCTATLTEHADDVFSVAVSDAVVATGSFDGTARIWPVDGTASRHTLQHPGMVYAVSLVGDVLATGCHDRVVRTFAVGSGELMHSLGGHSKPVVSVALCGIVLVSGSYDKTVKMWSVAEGEEGACVTTLAGHTGCVSGVALSPSGGGMVASLSRGVPGELIVWQPTGRAPLADAVDVGCPVPLWTRRV